jgi:LysM repeat protein
MSRRDTIIIAALLNAGLLVVLFTSALKTDSALPDVATANSHGSVEKIAEIPLQKEPQQALPGDEVDQVLREFAVPQQPIQFTPAPVVASPQQSFVEELNSLAHAQPAIGAAPAPVKSSTIDVVVKKGDVLDKIAREHHTSVDQIIKQNQLASTRLQIGQVLKVTPNTKTHKETAPPTAAPSATVSEPKYYTVKSGDNPWTIAVKNHMKVEELLKLNNLNDEKARHLKPGDQLRIR